MGSVKNQIALTLFTAPKKKKKWDEMLGTVYVGCLSW
jgi:hypothetical protein